MAPTPPTTFLRKPNKRTITFQGWPWRSALLRFEELEDRNVPSAGDSISNAFTLSFLNQPSGLLTARVAEYLASPGGAVLNRLDLVAGDSVTARVDTTASGGAFDSLLRVFCDTGVGLQVVATNDDQFGHDSALTFQASVSGTYYLGISSFDNTQYDPNQAESGTGSSTGLFDLEVTKASIALTADVRVAATTVEPVVAEWGEPIAIDYRIENRGGVASLAMPLDLVVSANNRFDEMPILLSSSTVPALLPGESYVGRFTTTLGSPGLPLLSYLAGQELFLGLQINSILPHNPQAGNDWSALQILESALAPTDGTNDSSSTAVALPLNSRTNSFTLQPGAASYFEVNLPENGILNAALETQGGAASLTLLDTAGREIVRSKGSSSSMTEPSLKIMLTAGQTFWLRVVSIGSADTTNRLTTLFTPTATTLTSTDVGGEMSAMVQGDFNGDGWLDLATANRIHADGSPAREVAIFLNEHDGSFRNAGIYTLGFQPLSLLASDLNHDGVLDLAASSSLLGLTILRGVGDGTFENVFQISGVGGDSLTAGDLNGDGNLDLAGGSIFERSLFVFFGDGTGQFSAETPIAIDDLAASVLSADFNHDGITDLAFGGKVSHSIVILEGQPNGTLLVGSAIPMGDFPQSFLAQDFNQDGLIDLAAANLLSNTVSVALAQQSGGFGPSSTYSVGRSPGVLRSGDFNSDGILDLAVVNSVSGNVTLLLGEGNGTFSNTLSQDVGGALGQLEVGDFDRDGQVDLAVSVPFSRKIQLLRGRGDGEFDPIETQNTTGDQPNAIAMGDFNGDGDDDAVVTNYASNDVTVLLSEGDGTFRRAASLPVGAGPSAVAVGDFNGDGRLDLAVGNRYSMDISVLLGQGDGSFRKLGELPAAGSPSSIIARDYDGDGDLDLVIALRYDTSFSPSSSIVILEGDGRGGFSNGPSYEVGLSPVAMVEGDFNGDGEIDLAVGNYYSSDVTVLLGNGHAGFQSGVTSPANGLPVAIAAGDFDHDGHLDLALATRYPGGVTILRGLGNGSFEVTGTHLDTERTTNLVSGDFNGDGHLDLAVTTDIEAYTYSFHKTMTVLLGDGTGLFSSGVVQDFDGLPYGIAIGELNGDQHPDLLVASNRSSTLEAFIGTGRGTFVSPLLASNPIHSTPLIVDASQDHVNDVLVLNQSGQILYRRGVPNQPGAFLPPEIVNPDPADAIRSLAVVGTSGAVIAGLNVRVQESSGLIGSAIQVTIFQSQVNGSLAVVDRLALPDGVFPADIASTDLNNDGLGDLIVTSANRLYVVLQQIGGSFATLAVYDIGVNPSGIQLADLDGDGTTDITVTDRFSGDVAVYLNRGNGLFDDAAMYQTSVNTPAFNSLASISVVQSAEGTIGAILGSFDQSDGADLLVLQSRSGMISLLSGDSFGGFANPDISRTLRVGGSPLALVAGDFAPGTQGIAVLDAATNDIIIYLPDGQGSLVRSSTLDVGDRLTGLTVADVSQPNGGGPDGIPDLLAGNIYGDLLIITGNGDGTFTEYRRADRQVSLAVAATAQPGVRTFLFSNSSNDRLSTASVPIGTSRVANPAPYETRSGGLYSPGAQSVFTVEGTQYLAVVNNGANSLLVYTLDSNGAPIVSSKQTYYTGTDPVSLTVTNPANDLNGDSIPDVLVVNQGSNDVSIFLGTMIGNSWQLEYRPRQLTGGNGPTSVAVSDVLGINGSATADGTFDLIVSNGGSSTISYLRGQGGGYFTQAATPPPIFVGDTPGEILPINLDGNDRLDLIVLNSNRNSLTVISNILGNASFTSLNLGGNSPLKAIVFPMIGSGLDTLLVANAGSNEIELYQQTALGFSLIDTFDQSLLPNISDLVMVRSGDTLEIYGSDSSSEIAMLLGSFSITVPPPFIPPSPGFENEIPLGTSLAPNVFFSALLSRDLNLSFEYGRYDDGLDSFVGEGRAALDAIGPEASNVEVPFVGCGDPDPEAAEIDSESEDSAQWRKSARILLLNLEGESQEFSLPVPEAPLAPKDPTEEIPVENLDKAGTAEEQAHRGHLPIPFSVPPRIAQLAIASEVESELGDLSENGASQQRPKTTPQSSQLTQFSVAIASIGIMILPSYELIRRHSILVYNHYHTRSSRTSDSM